MMNLKTLALATVYTAVLAAAVPFMTNTTISVDAAQIKQQTQATTISLSLDDLTQPHFLRVSVPTVVTQITGKIELNGKSLQTLKKDSTQINLSPSLIQGKNIITISGKYRPVDASVQVELVGPNTQVSQQIGGSGYINQTLVIKVK